MTTPGRRIYPNENGELVFAEGDYGFDPRVDHWVVRPPGRHAGGIPDHEVTEHEDGTITVRPSILLDDGSPQSWHGYLERGVWRQA
jgi:hypothetical protein